ncbi:MAG: PP2C family protein-serine/threonine phosphatase [Wujia sp.]
MLDSALFTNPGGRENNEDYVTRAQHGNDFCYILCDGLGGHDCGEVASMTVAEFVADMFREKGDYPEFLDDAFTKAQERLLEVQLEKKRQNEMKTTMVVLVVTQEHIRWGHIGDSRLYHIYNNGSSYERTRDHSVVQILLDQGEITEDELRTHEDRNKLLRAMGSKWGSKSYELSAVLERGDSTHGFVLMTDGFWEYVKEAEILSIYNNTDSAQEWLDIMRHLVEDRADMTKTDNYSAITVKLEK